MTAARRVSASVVLYWLTASEYANGLQLIPTASAPSPADLHHCIAQAAPAAQHHSRQAEAALPNDFGDRLTLGTGGHAEGHTVSQLCCLCSHGTQNTRGQVFATAGDRRCCNVCRVGSAPCQLISALFLLSG